MIRLTAIIALVLAALAILAGVAGPNLLNGDSASRHTASAVTQTVATVAPIAPTRLEPKPVGIGEPIRNGSLEFTVHGVRTQHGSMTSSAVMWHPLRMRNTSSSR